MSDEHLRFPIGHFAPKDEYAPEEIDAYITEITSLPEKIEKLASGFSDRLWSTTYREGGWTARQVVHHIPDSHMHAYIRTKWALTEERPNIKAYNQAAWAETPDKQLETSVSIALLKAIHERWAGLLRAIPYANLNRSFVHPETGKDVPIKRMIALYAWHGEHHFQHLKLIETKR